MAAAPGPKGGIIEVNDLRTVLRIFSKNWYFVAVALVLSAVLSYLYSYKIPNVFGASTQILLKDKESYDYQNQVFKNIGYISAYGDIVNQKRVLTSYDLIDRALNRLDFEVSYYIIGRFKTTEVYGNLPFSVEMQVLNNSLYEKPIDLRIVDPGHFTISYDGGQGIVTKNFPFKKDIADSDFTLRVDPNVDLKSSTIDRYTASDYRFVRHERSRQVAKYAGRLAVENLPYTTILQVNVEDEISERAKMFLDTLSNEYIKYTLQGDFDINENTLGYIDKQLDEVSGILNQYEDDLQNFLRSKNILDLNRENSQYFNQLVKFDAQKREYELMVESVDQLNDYVLNIGDAKLLPPSFYILEGDDFLRKTLSSLYDMQMDVNRYLYSAEPGNPAIEEAKNTIQLTRANLLIYLKNTRIAIVQKIGDVGRQINDYTGLIQAVPQNQRDVENYQRKVAVNEKLYEFLLEKRANTVIARAGIIPQTKVIEAARSIGIVRPNKTKILYTFLVGGGLISLLLVFVRVLFYDRIDNAEQLRSTTNAPVFGEVIASEKAEENYVVVDSDPKAAITESFRTIRTNLEYLPATDTGRAVMVTSYRPNEGKTFCSVNLSAILAKAGKKVLLLELDLHKPKVGTGLGMTSNIGISTILVGKNNIEECVQHTQIENFDVILAGATPPNASELVLSKKLPELFEFGRQHYDYVMIDTPPVGLITDALLMMRHVDATLFVINTRFANKDHVRNAMEIHAANPAKNFGFILNGVRMKKSKYYYNTNYGYGYRYAYGYGGYGYGYGSKRKKETPGGTSTDGDNQNS
ncbi:MAG TPA: polysaccharide biosynthesis tyrosine autokinase [Flavobacteriales bacterium]|nr:polysaccharide biosynthesis tyrosine autokinase [Flavobacteriales bacterium]HQW31091.1 polysaccharide biosynthesis tyrosine autokinase [Flavobacteriales bacterium]HQY02983.1 polysaccharide biosynthesis tyrosine autokinase [Flavobacteriales bacterium]HQY78265.1 polysaccharide biosynthesis tyrosine autokinase [Flavobacteriales bacterium]HRA18443.1 polysaccharide biosynthesis tyrosine autokinase [Flavobacteriales bacterium]